MADIEGLIARWQTAGVLDATAADRIRAYEAGQKQPSGLRWEAIAALVLGALLLACGVVLFVSAHWDDLGPGGRFALVMAMVAVFHVAGGLTRSGLSTALHAVGTVATGAAIALVGQIFNIEEHWPGAILMWALAAAAGWILLRDEAQQTLTLLLFPAWMLSEITFYSDRYVGQTAYIGRFLFVWAILYVTFFVRSKRNAVQGILFAVGAIAAVVGVLQMLDGWRSWGWEHQNLIPFGVRVWAWIAIAVLPLLIAAFKGHNGLIPTAAAVVLALVLPWCYRSWTENLPAQMSPTYTRYGPNLLAHALVAGFAVFLIWWGVTQASRALVNLGIVFFAVAVAWFYFSDIFDKVGRSLGLIGLGVLFLLGGWALERMRRHLIAGMTPAVLPTGEAR